METSQCRYFSCLSNDIPNLFALDGHCSAATVASSTEKNVRQLWESSGLMIFASSKRDGRNLSLISKLHSVGTINTKCVWEIWSSDCLKKYLQTLLRKLQIDVRRMLSESLFFCSNKYRISFRILLLNSRLIPAFLMLLE